MPGVSASVLDRRIRLFRAGVVRDEHGDDVQGFAPMFEVAASVKPTPGRERLVNAETAAAAPTVVTIRWSERVADLSAADRLEYPPRSGRMYDIASVVELGFREGLQIAAVTRGDA